MARMEMGRDMNFKMKKSVRMSVFSSFKQFGSKIVVCCSVDFLQEIVFDHLVRAN